MLKFLLIILFFFLMMFFLLGFSLFRGIYRIFFGGYEENQRGKTTKQNTRKKHESETFNNPQEKISKKLFEASEDEGEYVDFEEIKK